MRLKVWAVIIAVMVGWGFWQNYNAKQERLTRHLRVAELTQAYDSHIATLDLTTWGTPVKGDMQKLAQRDKALEDLCAYAHQYYLDLEGVYGLPFLPSNPTYVSNKAMEKVCETSIAYDNFLAQIEWNVDGTMNISKKDTVEYYRLLNANQEARKQLGDAAAIESKEYEKQMSEWAKEDK